MPLIVILSFVIFAYYNRKPNIVYVVPENYRGWVQLYWNMPNANPLPKYKDDFLVKINKTGIIRTSTKPEETSTHLGFYIEDQNGEWKILYPAESKGKSIFKDDPQNTSTLYFCHYGSAGWTNERGETIEMEHFYVGTYEECLQPPEAPFLP